MTWTTIYNLRFQNIIMPHLSFYTFTRHKTFSNRHNIVKNALVFLKKSGCSYVIHIFCESIVYKGHHFYYVILLKPEKNEDPNLELSLILGFYAITSVVRPAGVLHPRLLISLVSFLHFVNSSFGLVLDLWRWHSAGPESHKCLCRYKEEPIDIFSYYRLKRISTVSSHLQLYFLHS